MNFEKIMPIILIPGMFICAGIYLLGRAYLVGTKKKMNLIYGLDDKVINKIKKIDKLTKDYSTALVLLACSCFVAGVLLLTLGTVGRFIALGLVVVASLNLSKITLNMDIKLEKKVY